jgi:hypothetical protein
MGLSDYKAVENRRACAGELLGISEEQWLHGSRVGRTKKYPRDRPRAIKEEKARDLVDEVKTCFLSPVNGSAFRMSSGS